jgi:hypothetical protein
MTPPVECPNSALFAGREEGSSFARMPTSQNRDMGHPARDCEVEGIISIRCPESASI